MTAPAVAPDGEEAAAGCRRNVPELVVASPRVAHHGREDGPRGIEPEEPGIPPFPGHVHLAADQHVAAVGRLPDGDVAQARVAGMPFRPLDPPRRTELEDRTSPPCPATTNPPSRVGSTESAASSSRPKS